MDLNALRFESVDMNESEPSGEVKRIVQDSLGFVWYATREGVHRFDGYAVRTYSKVPGASNSIISSTVLELFLDAEDNLWVGTDRGVSRYDLGLDSFRNYTLGGNEALNVNAIVQTQNGGIYASTEVGYVCRYDVEMDQFVRIQSSPLGIIKSMAAGSSGELWIGSLNSLFRLNLDSGDVVRYSDGLSPEDGAVNNFVEALLYVSSDEVWLGTAAYGTILLNPESGSINPLARVYSNESYVHEMQIDSLGNIWICHSDGLTVYSSDAEALARYNRNDAVSPLPSSGIHSMLLDAQGNVWAGSRYHGIYMAARNKLFHRIPDYVIGNEKSRQTVVSSLLFDSQGNLWVGRNATGIDVFPAGGGAKIEFRNDPSNSRSLGPSTVFSMIEDSRGDIWIGTFMGGLQKYNPETEDFETYKKIAGDDTSIAGNDVRTVLEASDGNFWVNTHGMGICYFDVEKGEFTNYVRDYAPDPESLIDNWGSTLDLIEGNRLLVGTGMGFFILDVETMRGEGVRADPENSKGLSNGTINDVYQDREGRIWIGTNDGLNLYSHDESSFERFSVEEGLSNRVVVSIIQDDDGFLWLGTYDGLSRFDPETGKVSTYTAGDGLGHDEFYPRAVTKDFEGRLYFGHRNGVVFFRPSEIEDNTVVPEVYISGLKALNRSLRIDPENGGLGTLDENILELGSVRLGHDQKVFSIEFVALNYIQPDKNQYAYKLDGFDEHWSYVGSRREATYTNLNPGRYVFMVKASNNDGYWNEVPRILEIIIQRPYWQTPWFRGLAVVLAISLPFLYAIRRLKRNREQKLLLESTVNKRTSDLQRAHEELGRAYKLLESKQSQIQVQNAELLGHRQNLEKMVATRTRELEVSKEKAERSDRLKSAFLANMSHEIRTPMNAIVGLLEIVHKEDLPEDERETYAEVIRQSSRTLMTLIDDILDLSRIESGEATLQLQPCRVDEVCEELYSLFRYVTKKESDGDVVLKLVRDGVEGSLLNEARDEFCLEFDPVRLKQILTNLLSNAIKFTEKGEILFGYDSENLGSEVRIRFFVSDSGVGIPQDHLEKIFDRFHKVEDPDGRVHRGTGLGLTISKRLSEMMSGVIEVNSEVGKGTCFSATFTRPIVECEQGPDQSETPEAESVPVSLESAPDLRGVKVLLVEDEEPNYLFIEKALRSTGAEITWAQDGVAAIEAFDEGGFGMVLLDVLIPKKDGYEVLSHIRSVDTEVPVIVQSAYTMEGDEDKARSLGASSFLPKPFTKGQLLSLLEATRRSGEV